MLTLELLLWICYKQWRPQVSSQFISDAVRWCRWVKMPRAVLFTSCICFFLGGAMKTKRRTADASESKKKAKNSGPTLSKKLRDKKNGETSKPGVQPWQLQYSHVTLYLVIVDVIIVHGCVSAACRTSSEVCRASSEVCRSPEERRAWQHPALHLQKHSGTKSSLSDETGETAPDQVQRL